MELSSSNIKKFLIFSQKKSFLLFQETKTPKLNIPKFQETETLKKFLYFRKQLCELQKKKDLHRKKFLKFWEMKRSRSDIKEIITFSQKKAFLIFHETKLSYILGGISKAPKTKISYNNSFYLFFKLNQTTLLVYKSIEKHYKSIVLNLFSAFRSFLLYISPLINFFYYIAKFFQIVIYLSEVFSSFIIKYIHLLLSEYLLYILISGKNMHKGLIPLLSL